MIENNLKVTRFDVAFLQSSCPRCSHWATPDCECVRCLCRGTKYSSSALYTILYYTFILEIPNAAFRLVPQSATTTFRIGFYICFMTQAWPGFLCITWTTTAPPAAPPSSSPISSSQVAQHHLRKQRLTFYGDIFPFKILIHGNGKTNLRIHLKEITVVVDIPYANASYAAS